MEALMNVGCGALGRGAKVAGCLLLALQLGLTQNAARKPAANSPEATRTLLIEKAHALEARGRPDMAIQLWQQILLSDPNNVESLAGLARDLKLTGSDKAIDALDRLRKVSPNSPDIAKIEGLASTSAESASLRHAGELARQGKADDAMRIYKQLYGDHPPDGDISLAYYQTLYGTAGGKADAIAGMRAAAARNPGDSRFAVELGAMLTNDQKNRAEGIRILKQHPKDANAQAALRQALVWDAANPASTAELREYIKEHPNDTELAGRLKENESKLAKMNSGIARTPAEHAAFADLNAHHLDDAEKRFTILLNEEPNNGRVAAGIGFLRMQQNKFADAITYLERAEANGFKEKTVEDALAASHSWYVMGEASQAFAANQIDVADGKYREALKMRPRSPEALNGLAGLLIKQQKFAGAVILYDQLVKVAPNSTDGWRGLFLAYARDNQNQKALAVEERIPAPVKAALTRDAEYLRTLATIYQAQNRPADAQKVLAQALALPFPDKGVNLTADTKLEYAGILMQARRYDQAEPLYTQLLNEDPGSLSAWEGLIGAHHEMGQDTAAIDDVKKMPAAVYESALGDPAFLTMLGAIYQQANQYELAQGLLERAARLEIASGGVPSVSLEVQLAGVYLLRDDIAKAYDLYHQIVASNPERADAWKGLVATLTDLHREPDALEEIAIIPEQVRKELEADIEFVQSESSLYAATGDTVRAIETMNRVQAYYAKLHIQPPATVEIQNAWLLMNTHNDRALYPALMRLGSRSGLTVVQRQTIQEIWANWSVRRAGAAMENGNVQRAVDILDAASQAFPNNLTVRKAVAGGYAQVGRAKEALAIFKTVPLQDATSGDFQGAVGAALAANDKSQAEQWLRQALERYPHDPAILSLAARYEQARGDNQRAADYYRASLAAMPPASPSEKLAHVLVYPDTDTRAHRAVTAADLQQLLDPSNEPFPKTTKLPPPAAYGPDPYNGPAPVGLTPGPPSAEQLPPDDLPTPQQLDAPKVFPPTAVRGQTPSAPVYVPQSWTVPQSRTRTRPKISGQQLRAAQHDHEPHLMYATLQLSPRDRMRGYGYFQSASFSVEHGSPAHAALGMAQSSVHVQLSPLPDGEQIEISANPPHSEVSDAWKRHIFSLMAGNRNAEALAELEKTSPDIRRQLEADVDFVQGEARLDVSTGDFPLALKNMNRLEDFYLLHRITAPSGMEVQRAWLLYNAGEDRTLYPVLTSLDTRADLTAEQRNQVETLWASWAVRRAENFLETGSPPRGVQLLQAAAEDYPNNMAVRRALAGAYAKIGRAEDALALFKTVPREDATPGDYQGAIGAALAATDMSQAESWLRQALDRFPTDPQILAQAARFEQARGNPRRAADFWRASLAAMPPGSAAQNLDGGLFPPNSSASPTPGDMKRLLDPRNDSPAKDNPLPPLPAYWPSNSGSNTPTTAVPLSTLPPSSQWLRAPSTNPLPPPQGLNAASPQNGQGTAASQSPYMGKMNLPPSEETIDSTTAPANTKPQSPRPPPVWTAKTTTTPAPSRRITSRPMGPLAAQAQALFADQTDGQLTQTSASAIHNLANAPAGAQKDLLPSRHSTPQTNGPYSVARYAPSAQEAATGAYSAPKQQQQTPAPPSDITPQNPVPRPAKPSAAQHVTQRKKITQPATAQSSPLTLSQAPAEPSTETGIQPISQPIQPAQLGQAPVVEPAPTPAPTTETGLTDEELQQRNLPPLRGPWIRIQRQPNPISPREEAEMQLRSIESGYSPWLGGTGIVNYRPGSLGYDHLAALEAPFEVSMPLGYNVRLTIVAKPVFLDSGQADGTSTLTVQEFTTAGSSLMSIPQPIGTLTTTATTLPPQQNAAGVGGEVQMAFPHLALAGGYTPEGFLVATYTGRAYWKPANGPLTLNFSRDPVRDTQLSYAGLRDPSEDSLGSLGQIWGGVKANQGNVQFAHGGAESGYYLGVGGQYLNGHTVETNNRIDGSGGAYWRLKAMPEYGNLSIGANFFGMHYEHNENAFTHGMGGYFSPQFYLLATVPFTWVGHYGTSWHYNILGSLGVQAFQEDATPLWPLAVDKALETAMNNAMLPAKTNVGANYDVRSQVSYEIGPHWFVEGFASANNSRNYAAVNAGFSIHYMFRSQPSTATTPTGIFPTEGLRPFSVP
ncbi:MAG: cellulose synthase subunit BcsC-related outer membrane protein [Terracidiphilus sp.]